MKKIVDYKIFGIILFYIVFLELIFSIFTYNSFSVYTLLFSLVYSISIFIIYSLINKKLFLYIIYTLLIILFLFNYIYYLNYSSIITLDVFFNSFKTILFIDNIMSIIFKNLFKIVVILVPYLISICLTYKVNNNNKFNYLYLIYNLIIYIFILLMISFNNSGLYSKSKLYFEIDFPLKNLYSFGLITSSRLNIQRTILPFNEKSIKVKTNKNIYDSSNYNILDISFNESDNKEINEINKYLENSIPSKKNIYTGILENKNLIFIFAESFNNIAINKEITPNLYRLFNEGFTFNNFYNPLYPVSTADGQYLTDISLFPSDAVHSLTDSNDNYFPYSLAKMFKSRNYKTFTYHNYLYDYYERDIYYKNMGFDIYKGIGNGLAMDDTRSDYDMAKVSVDEFINEERFFTYYLTISGHPPYNNKSGVSLKNYDNLKDYNYSDNVKYYLSTQMELDKMIGHLFIKLEEKNILDDTVIVLAPDHVPYGLTSLEMNEISNHDKNDEFERYRSNIVIYNKDINDFKDSDNYCSNIDILPTLLNLFGFEYDSRLLMGRDILSNDEGLIVFGNRNIVTKEYKYSNMNDYSTKKIDNIEDIKEQIYFKYRISRLILENDYYRYLFKE